MQKTRDSRTFLAWLLAALAALALLMLTSQPEETVLGFFLICCVVVLRLHMSKEPREAMQVKLL